MEFKEVWEEQKKLNKFGQNIKELQANRLYSYGYNQATKQSERRIKELENEIFITKQVLNTYDILDKQKVKKIIKDLKKLIEEAGQICVDWEAIDKELGLE